LNPGEIKYQRYYLWVNFVLFILGILFYLPKYFWQECEHGQVGILTEDLKDVELDIDRETEVKPIRKYFIAHRGFNEFYFYSYLISELLYLLNVIGQVILLDIFLGNELSTYGTQVFGYTEQDPEVRVDAIEGNLYESSCAD